MASRLRLVWTRIVRIQAVNKNIPKFSYKNLTPRKHITVPVSFGFSIYTWLGFNKELSPEDELIQTIKHCVLFTNRGEYQKAEQLLHIALRQAQQMHHQLAITYIYDVMANLAFEREQLDKAKSLFVSVTQRLLADGAKEDDLRVIHISIKLARISHLKKEYETAQVGYEWCLTKLRELIKEDKSDANKTLLAITEDWYGRLFIDCNKFNHGLTFMLNALNRIKEVPNIEAEHIVIQLNDVGTIYDATEQYDKSIEYFKEAVDLGSKIQMNDLSTMYVNLGKAYLKRDLINEARKYCGKAWKCSIDNKNEESKQEAESCLKEIKQLL